MTLPLKKKRKNAHNHLQVRNTFKTLDSKEKKLKKWKPCSQTHRVRHKAMSAFLFYLGPLNSSIIILISVLDIESVEVTMDLLLHTADLHLLTHF